MKVARREPAAGDLARWVRLADRSLTPPGLNRPEIMLPVMARLGGTGLATVEQDGRLLLGLALKGRRTAATSLSNSGLPLIDENLGEAALTALLRTEPAPLILNGIPANGPFWEALGRTSSRLAVLNRWERAGLNLSGSYEHWFEANFDRKRRNTLRRLASKLAALSDYDCRALSTGELVEPWIETMLALEASGWKGKRGTALDKVNGMAEAFTQAARALHASGKLRFWSIEAEGQAIAMVLAVVDRGHAAFGKIAFNENYAKFSPGVLIMLEATKSLFAEGVKVADGCAIPNHPMLDHLWRDRIAIADVMVAGPQVSAAAFAMQVGAERFRRRLRGLLRDAYYRLRGWRQA